MKGRGIPTSSATRDRASGLDHRQHVAVDVSGVDVLLNTIASRDVRHLWIRLGRWGF